MTDSEFQTHLASLEKIKPDEVFVRLRGSRDYYISNYGRLFSGSQMRFKKYHPNATGEMEYHYITEDGRHHTQYVMRMVYCHFVKDINGWVHLSLKDGDSHNLHFSNIQRYKSSAGRDITGQRFNRLLAIERYRGERKTVSNSARWVCRCDCGQVKDISIAGLLSGDSQSCGCLNRELVEKNRLYRGFGTIPNSYWGEVSRGAKARKRALNITAEQAFNKLVAQEYRCALTGWDIGFGKKSRICVKRVRNTASLDRIDSTRDYDLDNIQWVHVDVNRMKLHYPQEFFLKMCCDVCKTCHLQIS